MTPQTFALPMSCLIVSSAGLLAWRWWLDERRQALLDQVAFWRGAAAEREAEFESRLKALETFEPVLQAARRAQSEGAWDRVGRR